MNGNNSNKDQLMHDMVSCMNWNLLTNPQKMLLLKNYCINPDLVNPTRNPMLGSQMFDFLETIRCELNRKAVQEIHPDRHANCDTMLDNTVTNELNEKRLGKKDQEVLKLYTPKPILFGKAFYKNARNLVVAPAGGFKSFLSINLAANEEFQKCLFIILDSSNEYDLLRYTEALGNKAIIITLESFQNKEDALKNTRRWDAILESMMVYGFGAELYRDFRHAEEIKNSIFKKYGIKEGANVSIDEVSVLNAIIIEAIKTMGIDFVCIDSLNALIGDSRKLNRKTIRRITELAIANKVTLLCIHHTNKLGQIAGSSSISEEFDYIARLSLDKPSIQTINNETILLLSEEKARYSKKQTYQAKIVFEDGPNPKFQLISQTDYYQNEPHIDDLNLTDRTEVILTTWEKDTITFDELKRQIGGNPPPVDRSIKNCLKTLSDKGIAKMTDMTWYVIQIVRK